MTSHGEVAVNLEILVVDVVILRVFLSIHRTHLKRSEDFGVGQRNRLHAQRFHHISKNLTLGNADGQPFQILYLFDRALAVGNIAPAVVPVAQQLDAILFAIIGENLAFIAVYHGKCLLSGIEQIRHIHRLKAGHDVADTHRIFNKDIDGAQRSALHGLGTSSQLVGRIDIQIHGAVRILGQLLVEVLGSFLIRMARGTAVMNGEGVVSQRGCTGQHQGGAHGKSKDSFFHGCILHSFFLVSAFVVPAARSLIAL